MNEKWLIRLRNCENDDIIAAYYTENPEQNLKTFYFCKEHGLGIQCPNNYSECYKYRNCFGIIDEIEVGFRDEESYSYIDVWLKEVC